jgi:acetyltransferase
MKDLAEVHYLSPLFEPRSVAIVGATEVEGKIGSVLIDNMLASRFQGRMFGVNPKYRNVRGVPCIPSMAKLPLPVDLAVIATPPATVPQVIADCGAAGVLHAVVITAGFSEAGVEGARLQEQLMANAHRYGLRLIGPNCLGILRPSIGLNATFARGGALTGSLGLISQSGAVCTAMLDWAVPNKVGFSSVISLGGSIDIDFGEIIDYLAADTATEHILLYIEGIRDARRFIGSLRAAARVKPVIVMKTGRNPAGSRAAVSHTGAIVGGDDVFEAAIRRTGAVRAYSIGELITAAQALTEHVRPRGSRLAIVTNGGGPGVMAADRAADLKLPLAELGPATLEALQEALPANWSHGNPIDLIGDADSRRYRVAITACLADPGVDGVLALLTPQAMTDADSVAGAVLDAAKTSTKPLLAVFMGEASVIAARDTLERGGIPVFATPDPAVELFFHLSAFYRNQQLLLEVPPPLTQEEPPDIGAAKAIIEGALAAGRTTLSQTESKRLLAAFRISVAMSIVVPTLEQALEAVARIGYPVALKINSPDITHKSDAGGVRLNISNPAELRTAWAAMFDTVARNMPKTRLEGASLESMVTRPNGRELMIGVLHDNVFGPAISFGSGGIAVEIQHDRSVGIPPLNSHLALAMMRETRVFKMLGVFRNLPAADLGAVENALLRVSEMVCELPWIQELDINPLIADENGVIAVDARVVVRALPESRGFYDHLSIPPYPADLTRSWQLPDGSAVTVRAIRPEDAELEAEFVKGLSPDSRHLRFMSGQRELTPEMLARFTQIDYDREIALVVVQQGDGVETEIGVARYVANPDGASCEFAIVLADAWQGRGLGRELLTRLIEIARNRGLKSMIGFVFADNPSMLELCRKLGFAIGATDSGSTRRVVLDLSRFVGTNAK